MSDGRRVSLFRDGRNQAVHIPREFELHATLALVHKEGDSLVITPIMGNRLLAMLAAWEPLDEVFSEGEDPPPPARDIF